MTTKITYEMGDYLKEIYGNDCAFVLKNASYDTVWSNEKLEEQLNGVQTLMLNLRIIKDDYTKNNRLIKMLMFYQQKIRLINSRTT